MTNRDKTIEEVKAEALAAANAKGLSDDAKSVASSFFGMGKIGATVHFGMRGSRPTERTQRGLDELVEKGVVQFTPDETGPGFTYTSLEDCRCYYVWYGVESGLFDNLAVNRDDPRFSFSLTEPINPGAPVPPTVISVSGTPETLALARQAAGEVDEAVRRRRPRRRRHPRGE